MKSGVCIFLMKSLSSTLLELILIIGYRWEKLLNQTDVTNDNHTIFTMYTQKEKISKIVYFCFTNAAQACLAV